MLFGPTFEETVAKLLSWKSKSTKLFEALSQQCHSRKQEVQVQALCFQWLKRMEESVGSSS